MDKQFEYRPREELQTAVIQAFAHHQEVSQIFFFGKGAEGTADLFSDIDMVVCSRHVRTTQYTYRQTFTHISSIRSTLLLESTPQHFAEMIMLTDYSPYQKIDFSIVNNIHEKYQFAPFCLMYDQDQGVHHPSASPNALEIMPFQRDTAYMLQDILFSVPRFTKCLFRHDGDMYRRWKSISNSASVLLYEKYFGWQQETVKKSLTAYETKHLYAVLTAHDRQRIDAIYPTNGVLHLADSYQTSIELIIELSSQKATDVHISLDTTFITYIMQFLETEIHRYHDQMG